MHIPRHAALRFLLTALVVGGATASCGPKQARETSPPPSDLAAPSPFAVLGVDSLGVRATSAADFPPDGFISEMSLPEDSMALEEEGMIGDSSGAFSEAVMSDAYRRYQRAQELIRQARQQVDTALVTLDSIPEYTAPEIIADRDEMVIEFSRLVRQLSLAELGEGSSRNGEMPLQMNEYVEREIKSFQTRERQWFLIWYQRSGRYLPYLTERMRKENMPEQLAYLPMIESGYSTKAHSSARALGLWQFIASTGYRYGLSRDRWRDERMDFERSTTAAIAYLKDLHALFGDWNTALAAYNCGEGRVSRTINRQREAYLDDFWDLYVQLPSETARYVPRFHAALTIVNDAESYGFTDLPERDGPLDWDTLVVEREMRLSHIADRVGVSADELELLNPELRHKITPEYEYTLRVPKGKADRIAEIVNTIPVSPAPRLEYVIHRVRRGETLSEIAGRYRMTVRAIQQANNIRNPRYIFVGQRLRVPTRASSYTRAVSRTVPQGGKVHVVRSGDTLWSISQAYGTTVAEILQRNELSRSSRIYPGQRLVVGE